MNLDGVVVSVAPAADDGFEQWWSTYPRKQGKKSAALSKWSKLKPADKRAAREVTEKMRAIVAAGGKDLNYVPYATTFLNGRRWEEWSDGTPPDWGGSNGQGKPAIDPAVESELQPWQRYCLSWFDEHGWNTSHRTDMSREEDQALRNAVEYGELSRDDVLAGKHPCSL